jgi:hypothetical protein
VQFEMSELDYVNGVFLLQDNFQTHYAKGYFMFFITALCDNVR